MNFGFLYNEFKGKNYYWEFIKMYKRVSIISILLFLDNYILIKGLLILCIVAAYGILTTRSKPFASDSLNRVDQISAIFSFFTILLSLASFNNPFPGLIVIFFTLIILINIVFITTVLRRILECYWVRSAYYLGKCDNYFSKLKCTIFFIKLWKRYGVLKKYKTLALWQRVRRAMKNYKAVRDVFKGIHMENTATFSRKPILYFTCFCLIKK